MNGPRTASGPTIAEAVALLQRRVPGGCEAALLLGPELDALPQQFRPETIVPVADLPGAAPVCGGANPAQLVFGDWNGRRVALLRGPFAPTRLEMPVPTVLPIRLLSLLGARVLLIFAAAGGLNATWKVGDIVLVDDHINLTGRNPLTGPNLDELGPRFPDMSNAYDRGLLASIEAASSEARLALRRGVLAAMPGPCPPTRSEARMLQRNGADLAGCGVVHEVITARHCGMRVSVIALLTSHLLADPGAVPEPRRQTDSAVECLERCAVMLDAVLGRSGACE